MAIARPVRALGLAAIVMWCFFLYQVFWTSSPTVPASTPKGPDEKFVNMEKDPMADRMLRRATKQLEWVVGHCR
jgi:mannosyltransferase